MGNSDPDPPLVSNILEMILIILLAYLLFYTLINNFLVTKSNYLKMLLPIKHPNAITMRMYQTNQNKSKPFAKITDPPKLDFSLVISIENCKNIAYKLIESIFNDVKVKCKKKGWTFEIIIVVNKSKDNTLEEVSSFSEGHDEIRIMNLQVKGTPKFCMTTGLLHTSGRLIMGYFPFYSKSTTILDKYFDTIESLLVQSEQGVVVGTFPIPKEQLIYLDTNLGKFITWTTSLFFKCAKIKSSDAPLSQAVIMLRETAQKILPFTSESGDFAVSMLIEASIRGALIDSVEDVPMRPSSVSLDPFDRLCWLTNVIVTIPRALYLLFR